MRVGIVGGGPAAEATFAALGDSEAAVATADVETLAAVDLGVVVGPAGHDRFRAANRTAGGETPWLAVELGGLTRPLPDLEAAVAGFAPATGCYDCLRRRVVANLADATPESDADRAVGDGTDPPTARLAGTLAGRAAARLLTGGESTVLGGVVEVPHAERRFLPVPGCDCEDSPPDRDLAREHQPRSLDEALERAERALDPRVGLVHQVGEVESFPLPYYLATLADTAGFSDVAATEHAAGVDADWNAAFVKALGEGLERYAAGVYRADRFVRGPGTVEGAVPPSAFVTHPDYADPADPAAGSLPWVPGVALHTGERAHLPAEFVHFPPPETRFRPSITTGLGLGNSPVGALLSGLYETVERDAAMLAWYSTFEPLGLEVSAESHRTLVRRARSEDLDVTTLLLTQDVDVPVVAACVHRDPAADWPRFAAGMAADLDPVAAATDALAEALQNWLELRGMGREDAADESGAIGHYADFPETARGFVTPETTVPAASVGPGEVPEGATELEAVLGRLADADLEAFATRLTTRDLEALGFEAVRVLVPAAQPLFTDDPYFGERAERVPRDMGFEARLDREHHPFP